MKKEKLTFILPVLVAVLLVIGYAATFTLWREYKKKTDLLDKQDQFIARKLKGLEKSLGNFKLTLNALDEQFAKHTEDLLAIKDKLRSGEAARGDILSKMEGIMSDIRSWQEKYSLALRDFKARVDTLAGDINPGKGIETVELGEISVKKSKKNNKGILR